MAAGKLDGLHPLLPCFQFGPLVKNEQGQAVQQRLSLDDHFQLAPFFSLKQPPRACYKVARQLGKTICVTAQKIMRGGLIPGFHNLTVQPRHDQIERYDTTILRPLLRGFAFKESLLSRGDTMNIASKQLANGSMLFLDYAFITVDRIRGYSGLASTDLDEAQDIEWDFIPIIEETMSANPTFSFTQLTGTPKTSDGTLGYAWERSSQAEWVIKCQACNFDNIPSVEHHLLKMIGKTTCVCYHCGKGLDARPPLGRYVHAFPERRSTFAGYHVSQVIHPIHYRHKAKWMRLLDKQASYGTTKFRNEVLGETHDAGAKLLTSIDIKKACNGLKSDLDECVANRRTYEGVLLGVDWSGGGGMEVSWTVVVAVGFRPGSDVLDCIYAVRLPQGNTPEEEAAQVMHIARSLKAAVVAHDYGGAGHLRETLLRQAGYPTDRIAPFTYVASAKDVVTYNKPAGGSRSSYSLDKARSLAILCAMIRGGKVTLPRWSPAEPAENVLIGDLLNLSEQPKDLPRGGMMYTISKRPGTSDDFAHALNYACTAIWHIRQCYPNIAEAERFRAPVGEIELADPASMIWAVNKQKPR